MTSQAPSNSRGWLVTIAALGINLILGSLYAWGVVAKTLVGQGWTKMDAALPFTASTACFAFTMIFAGRWQDKMGPRVVSIIGGLVLGVGLFASAYATTPTTLLLTFGVIGGIGIGLCYSATTPPSVKWFPPARKGLIMGIVVSGVGLAAVYASPLAQYLIGTVKLPAMFMIEGVASAILIFLFSMALSNPPAGYVPVATSPAKAAAKPIISAKRDYDWKEVLATAKFYQLWVMLALAASAGLMVIAQVAIIGKEQANLKWGFLPIAMLAIFNTGGRLLGGYVSDRIGRTYTLMIAFGLQAVNMLGFPHYTTSEMVVFGAAFTGLCYGSIFPLFPAAMADFFGVKNLGVNYGLLFTAFGTAGVLGPILGGKLRDSSGSWTLSFMVSAGLLACAAILALLVQKQTRQPAPAPAPAPAAAAR